MATSGERGSCRRRREDALMPVLRRLELAGPVKVAPDQNLVANDVHALERVQLTWAKASYAGEQDHRAEGRSHVADQAARD
jgi:hypothetical protein